jgi:hypothetical protein
MALSGSYIYIVRVDVSFSIFKKKCHSKAQEKKIESHEKKVLCF